MTHSPEIGAKTGTRKPVAELMRLTCNLAQYFFLVIVSGRPDEYDMCVMGIRADCTNDTYL